MCFDKLNEQNKLKYSILLTKPQLFSNVSDKTICVIANELLVVLNLS